MSFVLRYGPVVDPAKKRCYKCTDYKPRTAFHKDKRAPDGLQTRCKDCDKRRNPGPVRKARRRWENANPERVAERVSRRQERLANAPGGPFNANRPDYRARWEYYGGRCAYCLTAPAEAFDHVKSVKNGGSNHASNIRPSCKSCNSRKNGKTLYFEWMPT